MQKKTNIAVEVLWLCVFSNVQVKKINEYDLFLLFLFVRTFAFDIIYSSYEHMHERMRMMRKK